MSALKDALAAPPAPALSDKIGQWRSTLDDEDREAFDKALQVWPAATLARTLTDAGFKISDNAIREYKRRIA